MNTKMLSTALLLLCGVSYTAHAEIPRPDGIVYGTLGSGLGDASAMQDVVVFARTAGSGVPLAAYRMGDQPTAGDRYVLRFAHLVSENGVTPTSDSAKAGQQVRIYVKQGNGPEVCAARKKKLTTRSRSSPPREPRLALAASTSAATFLMSSSVP